MLTARMSLDDLLDPEIFSAKVRSYYADRLRVKYGLNTTAFQNRCLLAHNATIQEVKVFFESDGPPRGITLYDFFLDLLAFQIYEKRALYSVAVRPKFVSEQPHPLWWVASQFPSIMAPVLLLAEICLDFTADAGVYLPEPFLNRTAGALNIFCNQVKKDPHEIYNWRELAGYAGLYRDV